MRVLAGLGNPGRKYAGTRHNIGFLAVERIAEQYGLGPWRARFQSEVAEGRIGSDKVLLVKPQTYMNESGRALAEIARFYKLSSSDFTVFHDELDLAPGRVRVKTGGGHAGHNGLRSIHAQLGSDVVRVRLGIGHPGDKAKVTSYVLHDFAKADRAWLDPLLDSIARGTDRLLAGDHSGFMNLVAQGAPAAPAKPAAEPEARPSAPAERPASPFDTLAGLFKRR